MRSVAAAAVLVLLAGCSTEQRSVRTPSFDEQLETPRPSYSNGSLWQNSSVSLVEDTKARRKGDILTILIDEQASASKQAATDTGRKTEITAGIPNFLGLEQTSFKTWMDLSKMISASTDSTYAGTGSTNRKDNLSATISAKVVEVLPNGNMSIEGRRNVRVNEEDQFIRVEGTVRPKDIRPDNVIASSMIADARITYSGKGLVSDQQRPGWLKQIVDKVWPF